MNGALNTQYLVKDRRHCTYSLEVKAVKWLQETIRQLPFFLFSGAPKCENAAMGHDTDKYI